MPIRRPAAIAKALLEQRAMSEFTVDSITICDYAAPEVSGKATLAGVYAGEIRIFGSQKNWLPLFFVIMIDPLTREFPFRVEFVKPDEKPLCALQCKFSAPHEPPVENRAIVNWRIPTLPFTGTGLYAVRVKDRAGAIVFERKVVVSVGPPSPPFVAALTVESIICTEEHRPPGEGPPA